MTKKKKIVIIVDLDKIKSEPTKWYSSCFNCKWKSDCMAAYPPLSCPNCEFPTIMVPCGDE